MRRPMMAYFGSVVAIWGWSLLCAGPAANQHLGWNEQRLERRKLKLGSSTPLSKIAQNSI